jgi:hypothetical protein
MNPLGPFAMYAAFPRPDYYGPSAPRRGYRRTTRQPAWPARKAGQDGNPGTVPTFTRNRSAG